MTTEKLDVFPLVGPGFSLPDITATPKAALRSMKLPPWVGVTCGADGASPCQAPKKLFRANVLRTILAAQSDGVYFANRPRATSASDSQ